MKKIIISCAAFCAATTMSSAANAARYDTSQTCREFTQTIYVDGRATQGTGISCKQADGSWRIVNEATIPSNSSAQSQHYDEPRVIHNKTVIYRDHYYPAYGYRHHRPYSRSSYYAPRSGISISFGNTGYRHGYKKRRHARGHSRHYSKYANYGYKNGYQKKRGHR